MAESQLPARSIGPPGPGAFQGPGGNAISSTLDRSNSFSNIKIPVKSDASETGGSKFPSASDRRKRPPAVDTPLANRGKNLPPNSPQLDKMLDNAMWSPTSPSDYLKLRPGRTRSGKLEMAALPARPTSAGTPGVRGFTRSSSSPGLRPSSPNSLSLAGGNIGRQSPTSTCSHSSVPTSPQLRMDKAMSMSSTSTLASLHDPDKFFMDKDAVKGKSPESPHKIKDKRSPSYTTDPPSPNDSYKAEAESRAEDVVKVVDFNSGELSPSPVQEVPFSKQDPHQGIRSRLKKDLQVKTQRKPSKGSADVIRVLGENENIEDFYELNEQIYDGGNKGQILMAKRKKRKGDKTSIQKAEGEECVVKVRLKRGAKEHEHVWRSVMVRLLASKVSPHVLEIQQVFEDQRAFYIVMQKCSGGELFEFLLKETEVPETECKRIIREILVAVCDLHAKGLIHRDVKPENIMFSENLPESPDKSVKTVKLIDFDTCQPWSPKTPKAERFAGTPGYIAPEALIGEASPQSDLWSVGVILHILMTGDMPWTQQLPAIEDTQVSGPSANLMHEVLRKERIDWEQPPWPEFPYAADLCRRLLAFDPQDRCPSATEALKHPWLAISNPQSPISPKSVSEERQESAHEARRGLFSEIN